MRSVFPAVSLTAVLLASALSAQDAPSAFAPSAGSDAASSPAANSRWITPWDVYLGCKGIEAVVAADPKAKDDPANQRVIAFCALGLPRIGARFSQTELTRWRATLDQMPDTVTWNRMRAAGEEALLDRVAKLGQVSVGAAALRFAKGAEALSPDQVRDIRQVAEALLASADTTQQVHVTGYADLDTSGRAANQAQAEKRAAAVVDALVAAGVNRARILVSTQVVDVQGGGVPREQARAASLNTTLAGRSLAAPEARASRAGGVDISTLLVGTTDFLVEEAREQIENYLLQQGARRICERDEWKRVLRATCDLVPRAQYDAAAFESAREARAEARGRDAETRARAAIEEARQPLYFPGIELLRDAIREDLRSLPYSVGQLALKELIQSDTIAATVRERGALALYLLSYVEEIGRTGAPLEALQRAGTALAKDAFPKVGLDTMNVVRQIRRASELASLLTSARQDLRTYWQPEVLADSGALYTIKALALNLGSSEYAAQFPGFESELRSNVGQVLQAVGTAQGLLVSIEKGWAELRNLRQDSTFAAAREALVSRIVGDAVDLAVVTLPQRAGTGSSSFAPLISPVRELASALADGDAPQALSSLLQLSRAVQENGMLDSEQLRVLAFTTDIAQARQTSDVQAAFQRLVGNGPGYQGKRASTGTYWRVNGYVGLSAGLEHLADADEVDSPTGAAVGFTVPLGVEVGRPSGLGGSWGVLLQLVDLGAIASARIGGGDDVESFPEFSFGSVVAPGIFYVHSIGDSPFSVVTGFSYLPQARETEAGEEVGGLRGSVSVAVDIPLFP